MFFDRLFKLQSLKFHLLGSTSFVQNAQQFSPGKFRKEGAMLSPLIAGLLAACGSGSSDYTVLVLRDGPGSTEGGDRELPPQPDFTVSVADGPIWGARIYTDDGDRLKGIEALVGSENNDELTLETQFGTYVDIFTGEEFTLNVRSYGLNTVPFNVNRYIVMSVTSDGTTGNPFAYYGTGTPTSSDIRIVIGQINSDGSGWAIEPLGDGRDVFVIEEHDDGIDRLTVDDANIATDTSVEGLGGADKLTGHGAGRADTDTLVMAYYGQSPQGVKVALNSEVVDVDGYHWQINKLAASTEALAGNAGNFVLAIFSTANNQWETAFYTEAEKAALDVAYIELGQVNAAGDGLERGHSALVSVSDDGNLVVTGVEQGLGGGHAEGHHLKGFTGLSGTEYDDVLTGIGVSSSIWGLGGNDQIYGDRTSDAVVGGSGDALYGGAGNDLIHGYGGNDLIDGGIDDDTLIGGAGDDTIIGGAGNDIIDGGFDNDVLSGGEGDDTIIGDLGNDLIDGGAGDDTISGGSGNDLIDGGSGADTMTGGAGRDIFVLTLGDSGGFDLSLFDDPNLFDDSYEFDGETSDLYLSGDERAEDVVTDFDAASDKIRIATLNGDEATIAKLKAAAQIDWSVDGEDTQIVYTGGETDELVMTLEGFTDELTIAHFDIV